MARDGSAESSTVPGDHGERKQGSSMGRLLGVLNHHVWLIFMIAGTLLAISHVGRRSGYSWHFFTTGTKYLFSASGLQLYHVHPELQIGPLAFLVTSPFILLLPSKVGEVLAMGVMMALALVLLGEIQKLGARHLPTRRTLFLIIGLAVLVMWTEMSVRFGHLDDAFAIVFSVSALRTAKNGRWVWTAILLAAAVDFKPWAVAFLPILILLPSRRWLPALALVVVGVAIVWGPFLVAAPSSIAAGSFTIPNAPDSALRALGISNARTPTWCRPTQILLGALLALLLIARRRWAGVILMVIAVRVLLDPATKVYYDAGLVAGTAVVDLVVAAGVIPWLTTAVTLLIYLPGYVLPTADTLRGDLRALCLVGLILTLPFLPRNAAMAWLDMPARELAERPVPEF